MLKAIAGLPKGAVKRLCAISLLDTQPNCWSLQVSRQEAVSTQPARYPTQLLVFASFLDSLHVYFMSMWIHLDALAVLQARAGLPEGTVNRLYTQLVRETKHAGIL